MITFDAARDLVATVVDDPVLLREFLLTTTPRAGAREFGPGQRSAGEALVAFRARRDASALAGLDETGLERAIFQLDRLPANEPIVLFHWCTDHALFTALVCERTSSLVGLLRVASSGPPRF